jgi:hypothetical protein
VYETQLKWCHACRRWKTLEADFHRNRSSRDGHQRICRTCTKQRDAERYARDGYSGKKTCPTCGTSIKWDVQMCWNCRYPPRSEWTAAEIAWLAGLYEGEGSMTKSSLAISMTDEDVIRRAAELLGTQVSGPYEVRRRDADGVLHSARVDGKGDYKSMWKVQVGRAGTLKHLIPLMWPWLGARRREQLVRRFPQHVLVG